MTERDDQQPQPPIEVVVKTSSWKARAIGGVALLGVAAFTYNHYVGLPWFSKIDEITSATNIPEKTAITANTLDIKPIQFECSAVAAFEAGKEADITSAEEDRKGSTAISTGHGFEHASTAERARVYTTVCATDVEINTVETGINIAQNTVTERIEINIDSMVFNTQFDESKTLIVNSSGRFTQFLGGGADVVDGFVDILCSGIAKLRGEECEDGFGTPADTLAKTNREDQAKTDQLLRMSILKEIQSKCIADQWVIIKNAIEQSYKQSYPDGTVEVVFVDRYGREVDSPPDFTKSLIDMLQEYIDAPSEYSDDENTFAVANEEPVVDCNSKIPPITLDDVSKTDSVPEYVISRKH
jgi:hypothetical protein